MMSEEKVLLKNIDNKYIDTAFKHKALEALKINNYADLKNFLKKYRIAMVIDFAESIEQNREKLLYILNEEYYDLREKNTKLF